MAITITRDLNVVSVGVPPVIHLSQYDSDFTLVFNLYASKGAFTMPTGTTAEIRGTKKDGNGYDAAATVSGNTVTVTGDEQMTAVAGSNVFEIALYKSNKRLNTINFILQVEHAALDADTITSESVLRELDAIVAGAATATQAAETATEAAESVAGSAAQIAQNTVDIAEIKDDLNNVFTDTAKDALLACLEKVAWIDEQGQDYYNILVGALSRYPMLEVQFDPGSNTIYVSQANSVLTPYLTVKYKESMESQVIVPSTDYTIRGTLDSPNSVMTIEYEEYSKQIVIITDAYHYIKGVNCSLANGWYDDAYGAPTLHRQSTQMRVLPSAGEINGYDGSNPANYIRPLFVPEGTQKVSAQITGTNASLYQVSYFCFASDGTTKVLESSYASPSTEVTLPNTTRYLFANIKKSNGANMTDTDLNANITVTFS